MQQISIEEKKVNERKWGGVIHNSYGHQWFIDKMGLKIQTLEDGASIQKHQTSFIPVRTLFRAQNQNMKLDEGFHTRSMMLAFQEEIQAAAISQLEQLKFSNLVAAALVESQPQFANFYHW